MNLQENVNLFFMIIKKYILHIICTSCLLKRVSFDNLLFYEIYMSSFCTTGAEMWLMAVSLLRHSWDTGAEMWMMAVSLSRHGWDTGAEMWIMAVSQSRHGWDTGAEMWTVMQKNVFFFLLRFFQIYLFVKKNIMRYWY